MIEFLHDELKLNGVVVAKVEWLSSASASERAQAEEDLRSAEPIDPYAEDSAYNSGYQSGWEDALSNVLSGINDDRLDDQARAVIREIVEGLEQ